MTHPGARQDEAVQTTLRDILRIIATAEKPTESILTLLKMAMDVTEADGGCLLLFRDPRLLVTIGELTDENAPSDNVLLELANNLRDDLQLNPEQAAGIQSAFRGWLVGRIRINHQTMGMLVLVFGRVAELEPAHLQTLHVLIDGLTIVTKNVQSDARHEKLSRNQSEFMRIVSHDLRSPLTSIQGFASMLESGMVGDLNEKQAYFVEKILSGITQMTSLVENIQDAGRFDPETGFYEMERSQCDLGDVVRRTIKNHLVPAEKQELTLSMVVADDVPIINADQNMLERAISNLIDNAIKYTPNGRSVEVIVRRVDEHVILSVKDNGLGISPEHQQLLFERHVRIPRREHKRVKGSGLGLFIVRSVARRHGGDAWVESVEDEGSTFCISIPLDDASSIVPGASNS
jgi:signal transduction histidine kinase